MCLISGFPQNKWQINEMVFREKTGLSLVKALEQAIKKINDINKNQILQGLGELLDVKQKDLGKEKN